MSKVISPEIHFKGCTDTWEQRKLVDITSKIGSGKTPLGGKDAYVEDGICLIRSQNVYDDKVDLTDVVYIDKETDDSMSNSRVINGDVLLNITGASIGRSAIYTGVDGANVNQHVCIIRPVKGYVSKYIQLNISSANGQKQIESSQAGGGREGLNFQQIGKMTFMFPKPEEQRRIGEYFESLDNLITLHQRKYAKLKNYKSAIANKIFPAIGQQPVLRIIDREPWKEVPLSEIGDYFSTDSLGYADLIEDGKYKCLLYGDLYTKYNEKVINVKSSTDKLVTKLFKGDILFPASTTVDALSLIAPSSVCEDDVYAGGDLFGIRPKADVNGTFVSYYINNKHSLKNSLSKNAQGLTIVHIHYDNIKDEKIMLPEYDEQIAIVSLFTTLDNLIESENNYINKLKIIKQAFLDKMLIKVEA